MSKKKFKKTVVPARQSQSETKSAASFGYEEILSELEAIVEAAETRLPEKGNAA